MGPITVPLDMATSTSMALTASAASSLHACVQFTRWVQLWSISTAKSALKLS